MRRIREVLRLKADQRSDTQAALAAGIARSTVKEYLDRTRAAGLSLDAALALADADLEARLFPPRSAGGPRPMPDWEAVDKELRRRGVTLKLVWLEYQTDHPDGYQYTQFCAHFHGWQEAARPPTMRQIHPAGESLQVDYAGMTLPVSDAGTPRQAQIFVACLPCSNLIYAEATWTQAIEDWLASHVRTFAFLGGVPARLVPDNLKAGVTAPSYYDPVLNRSYHDLAQHYRIAVLPARVRRPRDKATVEGAVRLVEQWILAPLRHRQLFSLAEANAAIAPLLTALNDRPLAPPKSGSRRQLFEEIERAALKELPAEPYRFGRWLTAKVNLDYHIAVDDHFYSVPYRLVHRKVEIFLTSTLVAVFLRGERVASHPRSHATARHTTLAEHMPPAHQAMANRTPDRLRDQARAIGIATAAYVERLLTGRDHPEQGIRSCLGILRLATAHGRDRIEAACQRALTAGVLSSRYVERLLKSGRLDLTDLPPADGPGQHGNIRGPGYYN